MVATKHPQHNIWASCLFSDSIHVRRTDKVGTEAAFHGIDEYMEHVNEWFLLQERIPNKIDKRRVYIASDDPKVLPEARQK